MLSISKKYNFLAKQDNEIIEQAKVLVVRFYAQGAGNNEKLFLAWDADFTKLTPEEAKKLETARKQVQNGDYYDDNDIDWDNLDKMDLE